MAWARLLRAEGITHAVHIVKPILSCYKTIAALCHTIIKKSANAAHRSGKIENHNLTDAK